MARTRARVPRLRARVLMTPGARSLELPRPESGAAPAGGGLLGLIVPVADRQALPNEPGAEILSVDPAAGERSGIAVAALDAANERPIPDSGLQSPARDLAAAVGLTCSGADLAHLRSVDTLETDFDTLNAKGIPIDHVRAALDAAPDGAVREGETEHHKSGEPDSCARTAIWRHWGKHR